jgi:predicted ATPase
MSEVRRIAITGGPGAGKTTLWRALVAAHPDRVLAVPEVATLMFQHVFPSVQSEDERSAVQRAIFSVQRNLERFYEARVRPGQVLLCDRGTPDGGGYWPAGPEAFFEAMSTRWLDELSRYEAVLFLETAAARGLSIAEGNAVRVEDLSAACAIDRRLRDVWSVHRKFAFIACEADFSAKIGNAFRALFAAIDRD